MVATLCKADMVRRSKGKIVNVHNVKHVYPASMTGIPAGWVVVCSRGRLSYAAVALFTIGEGGAFCSTMRTGYNGDDGIKGFRGVQCLATRIYNGAELAHSLDQYFVSRSQPEAGSAAVLYGDGVYHAYGRAKPVWCDSTADVWQVLSKQLVPYKDASQVFTTLFNAFNPVPGVPTARRH